MISNLVSYLGCNFIYDLISDFISCLFSALFYVFCSYFTYIFYSHTLPDFDCGGIIFYIIFSFFSVPLTSSFFKIFTYYFCFVFISYLSVIFEDSFDSYTLFLILTGALGISKVFL